MNDDYRDALLKLLASAEIRIQFGPQNEQVIVYQISRTPNGGDIVGALDNIVPLISSSVSGGKVESLDTEAMLQKCIAYKASGKY